MDTTLGAIDWNRVGCAIFACGTEHRSSVVFQSFPTDILNRVMILEFDEPGDEVQEANRAIYRERLDNESFFVPKADVRFIIERVQEMLNRSHSGADVIFIDISSMPRIWYLSVIMWVRFHPSMKSYRIIVSYSGATYDMPYPDRRIVELRTVLGTGGYYDASLPVLSIIGLGFDAGAALTVEEKIEPDKTIVVISRPDLNHHYRTLSEEANKDIIDGADEVVYLSSASFAQPFQGISELISPIDHMNIICAPLGPKTHVLAFALSGLVYPHVSSIQVVSKYSSPFRARPNGQISVGEISFVYAN